MQKLSNVVHFIRRQPRWRLVLLAAIMAAAGLWWWRAGSAKTSAIPTFAARRGSLDITVLEGGSLQALESQEIKCEVRVGYQGTKILKIVEEGYLVSEEDVKTNKVLCELDSSELQKQIVQEEIAYQSAVANLTDAEQNYEIQIGQNQSDLKAAEQKSRFARMDLDKFMGDTVTPEVIKQSGLDKLITLAANDASNEETNTEAATIQESTSTNTPVAPPNFSLKLIDFSRFANIDALGDGEAKQKLRQLEDDLQVAQKQLGQARSTMEGTRRLFDKGFVSRTEQVSDEISYESARLKVQTAETARALYLKYEFPKSSEEALSKFADAVREEDKARRVAISKLAQARAKLNSAKGQYEVQSRQRKDLTEQLDKCTLRAQKTGLVVYGSGRDDMGYYGGQEPIREGASVREQQAILTIPDMTRMAVKVKIHESYIKKVHKGLKARITVDAFPDEVLTGEVTKVGLLPDSQNRWMSPDLKVYITTVTIDGTHAWVKPGMSAKVQILVNKLDDVIYVPVQAVAPEGMKQVCYVAGAFKPERREVEVGEFTDEFIQIKSGLKEGERVLLRVPDGMESQPSGSAPPAPAEEKPAPTTTAAAKT
jgi:HlyD family secretion protein